ncbi:MAG: anaerobic ribonucleoside-triphosphate reductase activating protein [Epsilonproteobacteria bacterium]|nr:anaerobic ribonucleoside-triphosphate reductase activating protein [Campylobacterota bacterium]
MSSICDITPFTLQDFEGLPACIVWFSGCNMRCAYCYNLSIVLDDHTHIEEQAVLDFLDSRRGLLEGVVLCGGEPTRYARLYELCRAIKSKGFAIKLDTNGSNPKMLQRLAPLLDCVALDFKAPGSTFYSITHSHLFKSFEESFCFLLRRKIAFEVRTTYHSKLLSYDDLSQMCRFLAHHGYKAPFYIQNYRPQEFTLRDIGNSEPFDIRAPLKTLRAILEGAIFTLFIGGARTS